jgi:hypothetical protein
MLRVPILLLASFPRLTMLFFLCMCLPFMWFSLYLFLLFLGVGFEFNLAPFWGCLKFVSCALLVFVLLPCWCLCYTWEGCSSQRKVSARLNRFMVGHWSSFKDESSCAFCEPQSHHSWEDSSTTHFHQCLTLGRVSEYILATRAFQPMMPTIPLEDTIVALR